MNSNYIFPVKKTEHNEIMDVWEASVRATHDFLNEDYILHLKKIIPESYLALVDLYGVKNEFNKIIAFLGIHDKHLEMLFIDPNERGKGLGKQLIGFCLKQLGIQTVDVNEQNHQAVGFYLKMGFTIIGRDETDSEGNPFPILHLKWDNSHIPPASGLKLVEKHPLGFFLPENTRVLMLGSFPPPRKRWSMDFYYPNIQNDMWRILGLLFYNDKEYFIIPGKKAFDKSQAEAFCKSYGIGIGDTGVEIVRLNDDASDKFLVVVTPWNPEEILSRIPKCHTIVITGQKSMETFLKVIPVNEPKVGNYSEFEFIGRKFRLYRMPSTSRAYPRPLEEKADVYGKMFLDAGLLSQ